MARALLIVAGGLGAFVLAARLLGPAVHRSPLRYRSVDGPSPALLVALFALAAAATAAGLAIGAVGYTADPTAAASPYAQVFVQVSGLGAAAVLVCAMQAFGAEDPRAREASPAVVVTWSGMLPRRSRSPVVCYLANPLVFAGGGLGNSLRRWAVRRTARAAAHVLVPTAGMGELVAEHVGRRPEIVPLGVDHSVFNWQARQATRSSASPILIATSDTRCCSPLGRRCLRRARGYGSSAIHAPTAPMPRSSRG